MRTDLQRILSGTVTPRVTYEETYQAFEYISDISRSLSTNREMAINYALPDYFQIHIYS